MTRYISLFLIITLVSMISTTVFAKNVAIEYDSITVEHEESLNYTSSGISCPDIEGYLNEQIILPKGSGNNTQVPGVFYENFATYYFSQLQSNFGFNHKGTCSYVATAMLLSYYDTYWDDSIISDQYDKTIDTFNNKHIEENEQSPGIKGDEEIIDPIKQTLGGSNVELDNDMYDSVVINNYTTYFHFYLLNLGMNQMNKPYGIYPWDIEELLEYYLYNERGYNSSQVTIERKKLDTQDEMKSYIIEKVTQKIPVIVCAGYWENGLKGHSFIVYDYDEESDELYCHLGGKDGKYHVKCSSIKYSTIGGIISLNFTTEHSCSNNYVTSDGTAYCSCFFSCHPEHEHHYTPTADGNHHTYLCECDPPTTPFEHDMSLPIPLSGTEHGRKCLDCNYVDESTVGTHSFNSWVYVNNTTHRSTCSGCNARGTKTASHAFMPLEGSLLDRVVCIGCGYTKNTGSDSGQIIMSITKVSANGSHILSDGTIMLVEEDVEAYLNGTLVFYDKDNLPVT